MALINDNTQANLQSTETDLSLIIALDVSYSVDATEYDLMRIGLASALDTNAVEKALLTGLHGAIQICVVQWSGFQEQDIKIQWTQVRNRAELSALAGRIRTMTRRYTGGATDISGAILYCRELIQSAPSQSPRQVIDLAADGTNNVNFPPGFERDITVAAGITINGLAVTTEVSDLVDYFSYNIIGGHGAFVEAAAEYTDFEAAMRRKLVREMQSYVS
jgi:hypothetical protein